MSIKDWKAPFKIKKGIIAGSFDIIHPGYINAFKESKENCDFLIIALQKNPSIQRPSKIPPILSIEDRVNILQSIKYVDDIVIYQTEKELSKILSREDINIRFLGEDYKKKPYTTGLQNIPIYYLSRSHGWSTTKIKNKIYNSLLKKYSI